MKYLVSGLVFLMLWLAPLSWLHAAPQGELSLMVSFSKTNYGNNNYSTTRRYMAAAGVNITPVTQIELSYTDVSTFLNYDPVQTTTVEEQILSLSVIQSLVPPTFYIQPYGKAGLAQYNRRKTGTTNGVPDREVHTKDPSAVLGGGIRIFLLRQFALKVEAVTFLPNMKISEGDDNFSIQGGVTWRF